MELLEMRYEQIGDGEMFATAPGPDSWGGSHDGQEVVTYQKETEEGYFGYLRGVRDGLYSESEEMGPYESREDVKEALLSDE